VCFTQHALKRARAHTHKHVHLRAWSVSHCVCV
jgi:hypothetical protein